MNFQSFGLNETLLSAVSWLGFKEPTEIQAKTIPQILKGVDVIGQSKTGSGKTAAYLLPTLNTIMKCDGMALVMVPTRELALQVEEFARKLIPRNHKFKMCTVIGGASMNLQLKILRQNPNVIISTPGRLVDHIQRGTVKFERLKVLVLDEADRMLDMGFYPQIKRILAKLPKTRQTVLYSATFNKEVTALAKELMKNPVEVSVGEKHQAPVTIHQQVIETAHNKKNDLLVDELNARQGSVLIFTKTKHKTDRLTRFLAEYGFQVGKIHGGRSLNQRKQAIQGFKTGNLRILVATDIAARGLDIAQVGHVINFDLPQSPEDYLHRVGRTGRAGASGHALSFVTPDDRKQWRAINKLSLKR